MTEARFDVVVPTVGRASLGRLLASLRVAAPRGLGHVSIVDDRAGGPREALDVAAAGELARRVRVLRAGGRGSAAARNLGWTASEAPWVVFLDDDVEVDPAWGDDVAVDLAAAPVAVGGVQGRIDVPLPEDRPPTDAERNVAGLASARWATADMAYRRAALRAVGGFDERFRRAYREDADLALRVREAGWGLAVGGRVVRHPVRAEGPWASVRRQAGNADDALMRRVHGRGWRERAEAPPGRLRGHALTVGAAAVAAVALVAGRRRAAAVAAVAWAAATGRFAWDRIAPGPRTPAEVAAMAATSVAIPFAAVAHRLRAKLARRGAGPWDGDPPARRRPIAVLLDRDGTLVEDVPYNGDPDLVRPVPDAAAALARLRAAGVPIAVVTNQSGVARGLVAPDDVAAVQRRIEALLGPVGPWFACFHAPEDACACRKPRPGLVLRAARRLGVAPSDCVVIGDTGADVGAAAAVGARAILVPNAVTRPEEVEGAPEVAGSLGEAVAMALEGRG